MAQLKSNLPKKSITNKPKIKNKKINKLELTVILHENPIKTKIKALVAGGVEVDACSAKCQWEGLNYSKLSIYNPSILTEFLKLKKDDEIKIKGSDRWNKDSEPNTPFISPKTGQITDWNLKQQNNIKNNNDDEIKVTIKNKDISENKVYQLEANYFNWLYITNELETNNIPSLIPAEIKLSDGEYGKYLGSKKKV